MIPRLQGVLQALGRKPREKETWFKNLTHYSADDRITGEAGNRTPVLEGVDSLESRLRNGSLNPVEP